MKKECRIVQDLLPLYIDEVVSKESNDFIEKHLQECKQCKEMLNLLKQEEQVSNIDEKEAIRKFHKKLTYKNLKTLIITLLCIIIILYIGWQLLYVNEYMVPYAENLANVEIPEDEGIDIKINTKNYKNGYNKEAFLNRYTEYFKDFDYVVGDWAYGKLRLKGFYNESSKNCKEFNNFENLDKYLKENCAFDCSYFVAKRK